MTIGECINNILVKRNVTRYKLAKELGVHQTTVKNWVDGLTTPKIETLKQIAQALEVDMSELLPIDKAETKTEDKPAQSIGIDEAIQLTNDMHTIRKLISGYDGIFKDGGAQALELALLTEILATLKDIKKDLTPTADQSKGVKVTQKRSYPPLNYSGYSPQCQ